MTSKTLPSFIGLAGIAEDETPLARRWGTYFEVPMLLLAIWLIAEWYLTVEGIYQEEWVVTTSRIVWLFFVVETVLLCAMVRDRRRYLLTNWMNLLIIAMGIPLLWHGQPYAGALRSLRVLLLLGLLIEMSSTTRAMLRRNHIGLTLFIAAIIILMAGTLMAGIDPAITNPWDGIWWAWVTVTTVGYGDIVPESPQGKIFGGLLMILGLGLFSLLTASFSAFLISREEEELIGKEKEVAEEEERAIAKLENIETRLEALEQGLATLISRLPQAPAESSREKPPSDGRD